MRYGIEILPLPVMGGQVRRRRGARVLGRKEGGEGGGRGPLWSLWRKPEENRGE